MNQCLRLSKELEDARSLCRQFNEEPEGSLRIATIDYFANQLIFPKLKLFLQQYPKIKIFIKTLEQMPDFEREQIDIAVGFSVPAPDDVVRKSIAITRYVLCASPQYFAEKGTPQSLEDLKAHNYLAHSIRSEEKTLVLKPGYSLTVKPYMLYYAAPISAAKNTITLALLGFSVGCIVFGTLLDIFGRRVIIFLGLLIYTIASFSALACGTIDELLFIRFVQGFSVSCLSIGCRTIIIDNFTGHQFKVGMLYTSLASGIGLIVAPFIGGFLQYHFGWKANFISYGIVSLTLMVIFALYISESKKGTANLFSFKKIFLNYIDVIRHGSFLPGVIISGLSQVQLLVYTITGAFLIENVLHRTAITYGNSALVISCGYLLGTIANRFLMKHYSIYHLIGLGFILLFLSIMLQTAFSVFGQTNLFTIIFPITLIGFSNGFIYINILTCCLRLFSSAGIATALFTSAAMVIGTFGTGILSYISVVNLTQFAIIFGTSALVQLIVFLVFLKWLKKLSSNLKRDLILLLVSSF